MFKQPIALLFVMFASQLALAQPAIEYEVAITNITPGQSFTPQLVVTHPSSVQLFSLGEAASEPLEYLAESGDVDPAIDALAGVAMDYQKIDTLLGPGETSYATITAHPTRGRLTVAAMMIPTNDSFVALNSVRLPTRGSEVHLVPAYDAGTEYNDQSCANIPGPQCEFVGIGFSEDTGEGYVHIGNGIHELGERDEAGYSLLSPQLYDWRNSVARITVTRK